MTNTIILESAVLKKGDNCMFRDKIPTSITELS